MKKKKEDMRNGKRFLTKEKDILNEVFSSEEENTPDAQKVAKRPLKRKSAAAPRQIENPPPDIVRTPRRTRRFNL